MGPNPSNQKEHLSGYWETTQVILADGAIRKLPPSNWIDFIEITGDSGVRKKLAPKLDGTFHSQSNGEKLHLAIVNDSLYLQYETPYMHWKEYVIEASEETLILKNEDGLSYYYQRYQPLFSNDE